MKDPKVEAVKKKITDLAQKINAPDYYLPNYYSSKSSNDSVVSYEDGLYHYVRHERARMFSSRSTEDQNTLLYWVFLNVTIEMALHEEGIKDPSRSLQLRRQELMAKLDNSWGEKLKDKYNL